MEVGGSGFAVFRLVMSFSFVFKAPLFRVRCDSISVSVSWDGIVSV